MTNRCWYPMAMKGDFDSIELLCKQTGIPMTIIDPYVANARIEKSELVVCDQVRLGDSDNGICAVLQWLDGGRVALWCAFTNEICDSNAAALELCNQLGSKLNMTMGVAEFTGRTVGRIQ